ncbi:MAG: hypothetical protein K9N23_18500 [Akkermansiaceae bacterium]|nr:hypothetical protein [Akkermansiaceae bacterium]MCF7733685.1 hypothetical protein [Akkermansiaceae bacterium]
MISELPPDSPTDRLWNFNDEVNQNYMLYIPANQPVITATLTWKESAKAETFPVGKFRIDLPALDANGYVRLKDHRYFLRFQRTKERIEIALNRTSKALDLGRIMIQRSDWIHDGGPGKP